MIERQKSMFTPFKKGDRAWLDTRNLKTNHHKKIAPKREGLFVITDVIGPVTYRINLPESWKIHNVDELAHALTLYTSFFAFFSLLH